MPLKRCTVSFRDAQWVEHSVDLTAQTHYEAAAQIIRIFRRDHPASGEPDILLAIVIREPEARHYVRMKDFCAWLERSPDDPAERTLKTHLRQLARLPGSSPTF